VDELEALRRENAEQRRQLAQLRFIIDFPLPEPAERARLWHAIWPEATPREADLDWLWNRGRAVAGYPRVDEELVSLVGWARHARLGINLRPDGPPRGHLTTRPRAWYITALASHHLQASEPARSMLSWAAYGST
jgi:hypothetical protein